MRALITGLFVVLAAPAPCDPLRVATYTVDLSREGPGLLYRDLLKGDPIADAAATAIVAAGPDVLLLVDFDYDHGLVALSAFGDRLRARGLDLPVQVALRPNTGLPTGIDLDGDGRRGGGRATRRDSASFPATAAWRSCRACRSRAR